MDFASILNHPAWDVGTGILMVVATALLVVVTRQLAKAAKSQTAFFERQEEHKVRMGYADTSITNITSDEINHCFVGFTLTNVGVPAVTITEASISQAIPATDTQSAAIHLILDWTKEHNGRQVSNFDPPHRLLTGDSIKVLYNLEMLTSSLSPSQRVRYECQDSFGNTYVSGWMDYSEAPHTTSHYSSPSEGFRAPTTPKNPILA